MAKVGTFTVRDSATIRDGMLRFERAALIRRGVENPDVTDGTDWYIRAQAVANQLAVTEANALWKADELMPDTATGEGLRRICALFGIAEQAAAGSTGPVTFTASEAITVAAGDELVDGAGLTYEVVTGGLYALEDPITIVSVETGVATNLAEGTVLRWVNTPTFADEAVTVGVGGLVNGIDAEDDEVLRGRLFAVLQEPPVSGNSEHVAEFAEASTASVQKAFVYPRIRGTGTVGIAVAAAPTATNKSRVVATGTMTGTVIPSIQANLPEHVNTEDVITTVADVNADVAIGLILPDAPTALPPGPGGGWVNGTPWPTVNATTTFRCTVTSVTSETVIVVDATTSPSVDVSEICWFSPFTWRLYSAKVTAVSGTSGAYTITLDKPLTGIATGCYIWPRCKNAKTYCETLVAAFKLMGPGEKTSNASLLAYAYRRPRSAAGWPSTLGGHLTSAVHDAHREVSSAQFLHRTDGTTTVTGSAGLITPQVPAALTDAPKTFVPRHIGFYRVT